MFTTKQNKLNYNDCILPIEILNYINTFICKRHYNLKKDICQSCDILQNNNHCVTLNYLDFPPICIQHGDPDIVDCILQLQNADIKHKTHDIFSSLHFRSNEACEIAFPYLKKYGEISHKCCSGKGVMFKINQSSFQSFVLPIQPIPFTIPQLPAMPEFS